MRFAPVKTVEQQAVLSLHRARQSFVAERTAQANQLRGLLSGLVMPKPGIDQRIPSGPAASCRKPRRMYGLQSPLIPKRRKALGNRGRPSMSENAVRPLLDERS